MAKGHPLYKTKWCEFHWRRHGCRYGAACDHAHGIEDYKGPRDKWVEYYIRIGKAHNVYPQVPIPAAKDVPSRSMLSTEVVATTTDDLEATDVVAHTGDPVPKPVEYLATWHWLEEGK